MQCGDVRVADERFGVVSEDIGVEMRKQSHGAVATRTGDDGLYAGVLPHRHETVRASLVLGARKPRQTVDLWVEHDIETCPLQSANASLEPTKLWRIRW